MQMHRLRNFGRKHRFCSFANLEAKKKNIRNVAVVAHVDHGKTTLVDQLLKLSGTTYSEDRLLDSIDLERERGITIMSKCTRIEHGDHVLNIVDSTYYLMQCVY